MFRPDDKIGPYTLIRELGVGGFGVVWLAEKRSVIATTPCAIKLPRREEINLDAIKQEAELWVRASGHPNVLPIIEADDYDGQVVIVSEYAPDGSLKEWLNQHNGKAPSIDLAVEMMAGILAGLEHLHERLIIHRDLKPDNILIQRQTPRLADFGIARMLKAETQSSSVVGTLAFMSPEAFDNVRNEQTDIWSVGIIFYKLVTGHLPFAQTETASMIKAIMLDDLPAFPDDIPPYIKAIIKKATAKDPMYRFKSAAEMRQALLRKEMVVTETLSSEPEVTVQSKVSDKPLKLADQEVETVVRETETVKQRILPKSGNGNYILQTDKAVIKFGGLTAVKELDMKVSQGEIYGLIGPNGAGKTTVFNLLTGVYEPTSGDINIAGKRINGLRPYQISRLGVSRTFQNIRLFPSMSVLENVVTACHRHAKQSLLDGVFRLPRYYKDEADHRKFAMELLEIFDLAKYRDEGGTSLPYGNQRRLEIVRALATRPQLLLLDEPAAGMNPSEQEDLTALIKEIRDKFNLTIVLVEHNMRVVMGVCDRIQVIDYGKSIALGLPQDIKNDPKVIEAYLGD